VVIRLKNIDNAAAAAKLEQLTRVVQQSSELVDGNSCDVSDAVAILALMVYNTFHSYWMSASDLAATASDRFRVVAKVFEKNAEVRITVSNQSLMINGVLADMENRYVKFLAHHMADTDIHNLTVTRGISVEEFKDVIQLLGKSPSQMAEVGGFSSAVAALGFKNIQARNVVLKEVQEGEVLVPKEEVNEQEKEQGTKTESAVLAFLVDDSSVLTDESAECLRKMVREPVIMAEMIVKAAGIRTNETPDSDCRDRAVIHLLLIFFLF